MVIITLETETSFNVRTQSYTADNINWHALLDTMFVDDVKYSIRVLQVK